MSDRTSRLDSIVEAAQLRPIGQRLAFLDAACGEDGELRRQVEEQLRFREPADASHHPSVSDSNETLLPSDPDETILPSDSDETILPSDSDETILPSDSDETLLPSDSKADDQPAASLDAGLANAFDTQAKVVVGNESVLNTLAHKMDVPRVRLNEVDRKGADPLQRTDSDRTRRTQSGNRYQFQGEIARGGMGAVIKGRDIDLGRDLAIKVLLDSHKNRPEAIQRFIEEAQIGGQLQHPGIAPVYELGQFKDQSPFFSMKLVKGETLSKLLANREHPGQDRSKFIGIFEQICQTIGYAHSRSVIHRDLKPSNVMVGAFGEVQVMDWGLAKVLPTGGVVAGKESSNSPNQVSVIQTRRTAGSASAGSDGSGTKTGSVMGTLAYMPPEQALGEVDQLDQRCDVFGLGAILCEILTGQPPYIAESMTKLVRMARSGKLSDAFDRLDSCNADPELILLAKQCLAYEPADRPLDGRKLSSRVTDFLESVESKLRQSELERASEAARVVEQRKRFRVTLALAACLLLVLSTGIAATSWQAHQTELARAAEADRAEGERIAKELSEQTNQNLAKLLAEAAKTDVRTADQLWSEGQYHDAVATYARSLKYDPTQSGLMQKITPALTTVPFLVPVKALDAHQSKVEWAEFSPDASTIATATLDGKIHVWSHKSGQLLWSAQAADGIIWELHYSPDGTALLTTSRESNPTLWDAQTGRVIATLPGPEQSFMHIAAISRDGRMIATTGAPFVQIWDTESQELLKTIDISYNGDSLNFSPCGKKILVSGYPGAVEVFAIESEKRLTQLRESQSSIHSARYASFNHDCDRILTQLNSLTSFAMLWDAENGDLLSQLEGHADDITQAGFSPDGTRVVTSSSDGTLRIWDANTGAQTAVLRGHTSKVSGFRFSADGKRIVSRGLDKAIRVWDVDGGSLLSSSFCLPDFISTVSFSYDGRKLLVAGYDNSAVVLDAGLHTASHTIVDQLAQDFLVGEKDELIVELRGSGLQVLSPDTKQVTDEYIPESEGFVNCGLLDTHAGFNVYSVHGGHSVHVGSEGQFVFEVRTPRITRAVGLPGPHACLADTMLAIGSEQSWDIDFWNLSGEKLGRAPTDHPCYRLDFSQDQKHVLAQDVNEQLTVVEAKTFTPVVQLKIEEKFLHAVMDHDRIFVLTKENTLKMWSLSQSRWLDSISFQKSVSRSNARDFMMGPDGRLALVNFISHLELWDWKAKRALAEYSLFDLGRPIVSSYTFSQSTDTIAVGYSDGTIRVWDLTGKLISSFVAHSEKVSKVSFIREGKSLVSNGWDEKLKEWQLFTPDPSDPPAWFQQVLSNVSDKRFAENGEIVPGNRDAISEIDSMGKSEDSFYGKLAEYFLKTYPNKPVYPGAKFSVAEMADRLISPQASFDQLKRAYQMDPGHPLIQIALSSFETNKQRREFLRAYGEQRIQSLESTADPLRTTESGTLRRRADELVQSKMEN